MSGHSPVFQTVSPVRRPEPARGRAPAERVYCFSVLAEAEPGVMPRVLELFAKRSLVPRRWVSDATGARNGELSIDVQVAGLAPELAEHIARSLRQVWGVHTVLTSEKGWG